jgi:DNA-binding LacI/PurR family transcriptional regulator
MPKKKFRLQTAADQLASHIRDQIMSGQLYGAMPGINRLATQYQIHRTTAETALEELQAEGLIIEQGAGKPRKIVVPENDVRPKFTIRILTYHEMDRHSSYVVEIQDRLKQAGVINELAPKSLEQLGMKLSRVQKLVADTPADAWLVMSGSREILAWFASQKLPAFAMFGRLNEERLAATGADKAYAYREMVDRLVDLGHQRIAILVLGERRNPEPGESEQAFLDQLEKRGVLTSKYHIPDWKDTPDGLRKVIQSLFSVTPPTALVMGMPVLYHAVAGHLRQMGLHTPRDVSLVSSDFCGSFAWCQPTVSYVDFSSKVMFDHVVRWAENIMEGVDYRKKIYAKATFYEGGTIGKCTH